MGTTLKLLAQDKAFQLLVLANILVMLCYSQVDATLVQYLTAANGSSEASIARTVSFYTWLLFTNASTILVLQFPLLKLMENMELNSRLNIGVILFGLAFCAFAFIPTNNFIYWVLAMIVLSTGEVILFPTLSLKIDRISPAHLKGSYFGAAGFFGYGFALGPTVGGALLHYYNGVVLWLAMAAITVVSFILVSLSSGAKRPDFEQI